MKFVIIFTALFAVTFARPIENTEEIAPCPSVPIGTEGSNEPEPEASTLVSIMERIGESQEFSDVHKTPVPTKSAEIHEFITNALLISEREGDSEESAAPETPAPTAAEEFVASTDASVVFEGLNEQSLAETPAPTETSEDSITSAPFVAERSREEASIAPETLSSTAAAEDFSIAPETAVPVLVSFEIPVEETPAQVLRTPEISEKPEEMMKIVAVPVLSVEASLEPSSELSDLEKTRPEEPMPEEHNPEEPKPVEPQPEEPELEEPKPEKPKSEEPEPEEPKPEEPKPEEPKPEEPKKLSRLITFTFYDRSSKATSLRHFLEYLRSLKK